MPGVTQRAFALPWVLLEAISLCSLLTVTALAQVTLQNVKLDVTNSVAAGRATLSATPFDIGSVNSIFDGDTTSLARTPNISPAFVQVTYTQARTLRKFRVYLSYGTSYDWWVEKADNQPDLDNHTNSYALIVPTRNLPSGTWDQSELVTPTNAALFRLNVRRHGGDNYCHINEWELYGDVVIDRLDVSPANAVVMYVGDTRSFKSVGHNNALNENYFVNDAVTWNVTG